jgi:hypothetical protein
MKNPSIDIEYGLEFSQGYEVLMNKQKTRRTFARFFLTILTLFSFTNS